MEYGRRRILSKDAVEDLELGMIVEITGGEDEGKIGMIINDVTTLNYVDVELQDGRRKQITKDWVRKKGRKKITMNEVMSTQKKGQDWGSFSIEVSLRDAVKAGEMVRDMSTSFQPNVSSTNVFVFDNIDDAKHIKMMFKKENVEILSTNFL